jgi:lipopolysaccharide export system ATP-binding protein
MEEENTQQQIIDASENKAPETKQESTQNPSEDSQQVSAEAPASTASAPAPGSESSEYDNLSPEQVDELLKERLPRQELHTKGLVKRYGRRTVADNVSFNVKQGEIVGLLGPNGAGKTTSFYMTTGLIIPNEGHVYIDNKEITDYPVYKRARAGIGYLPQEASVFRKMSVEDNIMAVLEMTKLTHQQQLDKLESLIAEFRLQKVRKNKGDRLSGGERRRTEIARCLAIDPKFIMLDEPFAGVDPIAVEDIQHIVWRLKYRNIGILITDHNVQETLSITDRAYLLFEGRILFQGLPEELAANKIVRKNYLSDNFVYRKFQSNEDDRAFAAKARKQLLKEISPSNS